MNVSKKSFNKNYNEHLLNHKHYKILPELTGEWFLAHQDPYRIDVGAFLFVTNGEVNLTVNLFDYNLKANDVIILLPGSIIYHRKKSEPVNIQVVTFLPEVIKDLHFVQAILPYLEIVKENPVVSLNNDEANLASDFFSLLLKVKSYVKENTSHNLIENMMMTVLYAMAAVYHKNVGLLPEKKQGRGDEIYRNLRLAIIKNYVKERKISFYANQLCITAKHLTAVVIDVSGRSVSDLISSMVILDAKSKLKYSQLTISQIADSLSFPDSSFFGKYFKKHTGLSPKEYRKRE